MGSGSSAPLVAFIAICSDTRPSEPLHDSATCAILHTRIKVNKHRQIKPAGTTGQVGDITLPITFRCGCRKITIKQVLRNRQGIFESVVTRNRRFGLDPPRSILGPHALWTRFRHDKHQDYNDPITSTLSNAAFTSMSNKRRSFILLLSLGLASCNTRSAKLESSI